MASDESPENPYQPSAVVVDEGRRQVERTSRWLPALATLVCFHPIAGLGLWMLGRPRRFVAWAVASVVAFTASMVGGWAGSPAVFTVGVAALVLVGLASFVDTLMARPGSMAPGLGRALLVLVLVFGGERVALYAVKAAFVETFKVPSDSMAPSIQVGDHVLVKKGSAVERGALVVHLYPPDRDVSYLKRVVALGGDTVEIRAERLRVNGVELPAQALTEACPPGPERPRAADCHLVRESVNHRPYTVMIEGGPVNDFGPATVPADPVFVLGDNRNNAKDSRVFGPVPARDVVGTVQFVFWSSEAGLVGQR